jgi:hypothetical protein
MSLIGNCQSRNVPSLRQSAENKLPATDLQKAEATGAGTPVGNTGTGLAPMNEICVSSVFHPWLLFAFRRLAFGRLFPAECLIAQVSED